MSGYTYPEERDDLIAELDRERERFDELSSECEEMCARLSRLEDHLRGGVLFDALRKLADYAGSVGSDLRGHSPADPFPDPAPKSRIRRKSK